VVRSCLVRFPSGFHYPKEYVAQFADDDGADEVRIVGEYQTTVSKCTVDLKTSDVDFEPVFLPGVPVHVYGPGRELQRAFVEDQSGERFVVYEAAETVPDDREQLIRDFVTRHQSDEKFRSLFPGQDHFSDWTKPEPGKVSPNPGVPGQ